MHQLAWWRLNLGHLTAKTFLAGSMSTNRIAMDFPFRVSSFPQQRSTSDEYAIVRDLIARTVYIVYPVNLTTDSDS